MDGFTLRHLQNWLDDQFGPDQGELLAAMVETYETDPELYGNVGWWRCHDDMVAAGRGTL